MSMFIDYNECLKKLINPRYINFENRSNKNVLKFRNSNFSLYVHKFHRIKKLKIGGLFFKVSPLKF